MITTALTAGVEAAMREASGRAIVPRYQMLAAHEVIDKAYDDVVTVADHDAEAILTERLAALLPEARIVGEEAAHADPAVLEQLSAPLCWIVDPLDGTNNFAAGKPPFGVLVALAQDGLAVGGWILDSLTGRFCHATTGGGAFVDGERITARTSGQNPPIAALATRFLQPELRAALEREVVPHYNVVPIPLCCAEQYPRLALGDNDISLFGRTLPWDHAAGILWLNEAGGLAARPDGSPYRVDDHAKPGLIGASSRQIWENFAEQLSVLPGGF